MVVRKIPRMLNLFKNKRDWIQINRLVKKSLSNLAANNCSEKLSYIHHVGEQPLKYQTIGQCLEEAANKWPDRPWVIACEEQKHITFSQMLEQADKLAASFVECGLNPGDRVGICAPNVSEWIITAMAAARANLILVTINPAYQKTELEYCLTNVGIKCLLLPSEHKSHRFDTTLLEIAPEMVKCKPGALKSVTVPQLRTIIFTDNKKIPGAYTFDEIISMSDTLDVEKIGALQKLIKPDDPCNIQFTSGTTGQPKGACLSHFNFVNNSFIIGKRNHLSDKHHKICTQVPLFHAFGVVIVMMASLQHGSSIVLPSKYYNPKKSLEAIQSEGCTILTGTPTMYVDVINTKNSMDVKVNSLEIGVVGGSPCSPQLIQNMRNELNISTIKSIYGMTETSASIFQALSNENMYQTTETVGHVQEHVEVKVVDSNGKTVPFGVPGELWTRGYNTMLGYWNNVEKTNEIYTPSKWLKTGDQFILQEDGYGKIVGRLKDVIIRGGENIYPKEIEDYLNTHPKVIESQVFGVKDERLGEEICAGIRVKEGCKMELEEMKNYCKGKIANYKIPRYLKIIENFPKTASGKIQKHKLQESFENGKL